jgi:ArsR family transcriptional regulator
MMTQVRNKRPAANPRQAACRAGPLDALLAPALFRALSDPTRASLVACIAKCARGCTVSEVAECCAVDLSVVSRHLALLARSGVLDASKRGRTVYYSVRYGSLSQHLRDLAAALDACRPTNGDCRDGCC